MWAWAMGTFSVAAVVNQIAIVLCRRAQACTTVTTGVAD
jgi:hypothetical protein